ncbi:MAG: dihydrolipoyl dehydrogenase [Candidatus Omnitrophica bacterium]|nr:dihydrolipoyl dehydrogenase [Candidatus Omnitrophota bacterium]MDE2009015.1 dihydrolipoyl dehydrogenase [Candidatus Omnitrophota bacterium]MDE2214539.1 dihydrolipoyl dehydrogenase [Candidatus Omnitrophota bacterium]MDE2230857.1 dihydrolipoyl dehydrogenase [Candidatus Omnitrophota bacterium]
MKKFDIITIGSGGGAKISSPAASRGLKVAVIEKDRLGGTCLNRGCIPSKMLIHPADVATEIKEAHRFDIHNDPKFQVDFAKLISRISSTVDADSDKIEANYTKHPNISFYRGAARFLDNKTIEINGEQITADKIFVAVGTRPAVAHIPGLAGTPFMTSTEALRNTALPSSMIIIGGGYIACELGHAYGSLGTKTTFLVRSKLLRKEDAEIAAEFQKVFSRYHDVLLGAAVTKVEHHNNIFTVHYSQNGENLAVSAQALLMASGITSNADTLDLINTGIELLPGNFIKVNEFLETSVPGVFALGDCIGRYFFRHSVNFEGEYLFDYLFGSTPKTPIHYPPMPHAVFTHPQVASVGATEEELKAQGIDYAVGLNPYKSSAMGMALLADHGFCKILVDRKTRKILGGHIIGPEASDMVHMIIAYMNMNATLDDMLRTIYIHPALPEIVRNAARKAKAALEKKNA